AMIIPRAYGGLGFSAYAHSEVIRKLSTRSISGAVTAMVPNSLGPGELLLQFGTKEQQDYWLPRLAAGQEIPCFGLTSPEAGSDAAAMIDSGVICRGAWQGRDVLGIRLNWHKRYITLAPVATVIGLAFRLYDPEHLIGNREEIGITVALVPTDLPGVEIGRRHLPALQMFQNGPTWGRDVFVPIDNIIGGVPNDALDVHGGKGVQEGPHNYLGSLYRSLPIGITVEGANIVTRSLIQFGQGAIRSHPYLLKEMAALEESDRARGLEEFDRAFWAHMGHSFANALRAWAHAWSGGGFARAPAAGKTRRYYRRLSRYAAAFALSVDVALLTFGGALKRQEMVSARFGDILSELYLLSAVLKRWDEEGRQRADLPLVAWSME